MEIKEEIVKELSQGIKTQKDLEGLTRQLMKSLIETALHAELDNHLGYEKNARSETQNQTLAMAIARRRFREILEK